MGQLERLRGLVEDGSVWRMKALIKQGITATTVGRALASGLLERLSHGTYQMTGAEPIAHGDLAAVAARAPDGVICLRSAAAFHELGDRIPAEIWLAIANDRRAPVMQWPRVRAVRWRSEKALRLGIMEHRICGVPVRITNRERTTIDMLRMARTVGEDQALAVLRDFLQEGGSIPLLIGMAESFGVSNLLKPYLRALSAVGVVNGKQGAGYLR